MRLLLLFMTAMPSQGVRELLIPVSPIQALYAEALTASQERGAFIANPALAVKEPYPCLHVAHTEWFAGTRRERVDFLLPKTWGTLGIGASGFHVWNLEHRDDPDDDPQTFSAYNTSLGIRYARSMGKLTVGVETGLFIQHIYTYSATGFKASLGAAYNLNALTPLTVGLSILDLGTPVALFNQSTQLPGRILLGASWNPSLPFNAQVGGSYAFDGSLDASAGIGGVLLNILHLYAGGGYGAHPRLGAGMALQLKQLQFAYSSIFRWNIGLTHHIGASVAFLPVQREDPYLLKIIETSKTFTEIGRRDMLNRDYRHAIDQFDLALVWWPDNEEAQQGYEKALAKEREHQISLHLEQARVHQETGEYLDALREYEFVLSLTPDNALALSGRTDMRLALEQIPILAKGQLPEEAINLFDAGVQAFRNDHYKEALAYWREIKERFSYIEEIDPFLDLAARRRNEKIDSLILDSYTARELGSLRQALMLLGEVLKIDPTERRALTHKDELTSLIHRKTSDLLIEAIEYFDARRYRLAAESFNKILALDPVNPTAQRYLDRIQQEEKLKPDDLADLNVSATSAYALGDYDTAIRIWEQILAIDSTFSNLQRNLQRARRKKELLSPTPHP
jgi:tetratricopeptide (TPR) repeat protein